MSAAATSGDRQDTGITSHGVCRGDRIVTGMQVWACGKWCRVVNARKIDGVCHIVYVRDPNWLDVVCVEAYAMVRVREDDGHVYSEYQPKETP